MDPKTALKYRKSGQLPSQLKEPHVWRTRTDPFVQEWDQIKNLIQDNPGLEAKTIFEYLNYRTCLTLRPYDSFCTLCSHEF